MLKNQKTIFSLLSSAFLVCLPVMANDASIDMGAATSDASLPQEAEFNVSSQLGCLKPKEEQVKINGKVYTFTTKVVCSLKDVGDNIERAKNAVLTHLSKAPNIVHSKKENVAFRNMKGFALDVTEKAKNSHGRIDIRFNSYLVATPKVLLLDASSKTIDASGDNEHTKKVSYNVELSLIEAGHYSVFVTKIVDVKRPWYAPESLFVSKAQQGITEDTLQMATHYSQLFGQSL